MAAFVLEAVQLPAIIESMGPSESKDAIVTKEMRGWAATELFKLAELSSITAYV